MVQLGSAESHGMMRESEAAAIGCTATCCFWAVSLLLLWLVGALLFTGPCGYSTQTNYQEVHFFLFLLYFFAVFFACLF